jgi:hypothetical protein
MNPFFTRFARSNSGFVIAVLVLLFGSAAPLSLRADDPKSGWTSLFDGSTLKGWKSTEFGGEGTVEVKDGAILLGVGNDLTGVNYEGGVCGLSSIDGLDASENSTTKYREFETSRWYTIRLRVTDAKIEAWIDKDQIVDQKLAGKKISIRSEVEASRPFGIASYRTLAALRNIRLRELK